MENNIRPTVELVLPDSGAKVSLYSFMRNGDYRKIHRKMADAMNIKYTEGEKTEIGDVTGGVISDVQELTVQLMVAGIVDKDGSKVENIDEFIYNLTVNDGDLLYAKVDELSNKSGLSANAKKK